MTHEENILILDFGSQYTQLIARRIREQKIYSEIFTHTLELDRIKELKPAGIILSGGPMSVYDEDAPTIDPAIFELGIPVLGICYGMQLICYTGSGNVEPADNREYGKANIVVDESTGLLKNVRSDSVIWMSHGDIITKIPEKFDITSHTEISPFCSIVAILSICGD